MRKREKTTSQARILDRTDLVILVILFAAALIPRIILALQNDPFLYNNDEFSTISAVTLNYPADWSDVLSSLTQYYGGGFTILFTPLLYLVKDSAVIYQIMQCTVCVVHALIVLPAYLIVRKHFSVNDKMFAAILSLCASYLVTRRSDNITNEGILYLLTWLILYVILELLDQKDNIKNKRILSVILAVLYAYSLSVHERAVVYFGMLAVLLIFWLYVYHEIVISIPFFAVPFVIGYFLARLLKQAIIDTNFSAKLNALRNTSVQGSVSNIFLLKDPGNWTSFIYTIAGALTTAALITGCLVVTGSLISLWMAGRGLFRPKLMRQDPEDYMVKKKFYSGFIFFFSGIAAIVIGQAASWLPTIEAAFEKGAGYNSYALKVLTYVRYFGIYLGPFVLLTLLYLYYDKKRSTRFAILTLPVVGILAFIWMYRIRSYIAFSSVSKEAWMSFGGSAPYDPVNGYRYYTIGVLVMVGFALLLFFLIREKWYKGLVFILCAFVIFQYVNLSLEFDARKTRSNSVCVDTYRACLDAGIEKDLDEIYVQSSLATRYQFLFRDSIVHPRLPDYETEEGIVLVSSNGAYSGAYDYGWKSVVLNAEGRTHSIFVKGEEIIRTLEEKGITFVDKYTRTLSFNADDFETVSSDPDSIQTEPFILNCGTYELEEKGTCALQLLDEDNTVITSVKKSSPGVDGEMSVSSKTFTISRTSECRLSVPMSGINASADMPIEDLTENLSAVLEEIKITKTADDYILGMDNADQIADAAEYILDHPEFDSVIYCSNAETSMYDVSYLESLISIPVSIQNEPELKSGQGASCILMDYTSDYLCFADQYEPVYFNSGYILLKKMGKMGDGYVDLEKLHMPDGRRAYLSAGIHHLRFEGIDPKYTKDEKMLSVRIGSSASEEILAMDYLSTGDVPEAVVYLPEGTSDWTISLLYDGEVIEWEKAMIFRPVSVLEDYYQSEYATAVHTLNEAGYKKELLVYNNSEYYANDLMDTVITGQIKTGADVTVLSISELNPYDKEGSGITKETDWIMANRDSATVFPLLSEWMAVNVSGESSLLALDTAENESLFKAAGIETLTQDGFTSVGFYKKGARISVPKGTFRLRIALDDSVDDKERVSVYRGYDKTEISTESIPQGAKEVDVTVASAEGFVYLMAGPGANESGLLDGSVGSSELKKYKILSVKHISDDMLFDLSKCTVSGGGAYDEASGMITGTDNVKVRTENYRVLRGHTYDIRAVVSGTPVSAVLAAVNTGYRNEIINTQSKKNNIVQREDGKYEILLQLTPRESRPENLISLSAIFEGAFTVEEIRITRVEK